MTLTTNPGYLKLLHSSCETGYELVLYDAVASGDEYPCMGAEGPCVNQGKAYRTNTHYTKLISNWRILCPECVKTTDDYWEERWQEYYNSVI